MIGTTNASGTPIYIKSPKMTSNNTPEGVITGSAPADPSARALWKGMDGNLNTFYLPDVVATSVFYFQYELPEIRFVHEVRVNAGGTLTSGTNRNPYLITVSVSSDGINFELVQDIYIPMPYPTSSETKINEFVRVDKDIKYIKLTAGKSQDSTIRVAGQKAFILNELDYTYLKA